MTIITPTKGQAEQDGSAGSSNTQTTRQSHTRTWAVARYVLSPNKTDFDQKLIINNPGTTTVKYQADQKFNEARDQAEQSQDESKLSADGEMSDLATKGESHVDGQISDKMAENIMDAGVSHVDDMSHVDG